MKLFEKLVHIPSWRYKVGIKNLFKYLNNHSILIIKNMSYFQFSCPLIPLLADGEGYPPNYQLPKRQRNEDALNLPKLTKIFRESIIYETINETDNIKSDLTVLNVLSPYSLLCHVMVMEISPNRFLPGPESFKNNEWRMLSELSYKVIQSMNSLSGKEQNHTPISTFCGFNWSPYSWGLFEERGGCQSITSKFHMMIWQWPKIELINDHSQLPKKHQKIFFENGYNEPFGRLVGQVLNLSTYEVSPRGIFIPIEKIDIEILYKLKEISEKVENIINNLNSILIKNFNEAFNEVKETMEQASFRVISVDEIDKKMRNNHLEINGRQECLMKCKNQDEKELINSIYNAVVERLNINSNENFDSEKFNEIEIWEKFFGFSLVLAESSQFNHIKNGLYIGLHPLCGPGGCAEVLGCYLTRPEQRMADEKVMIAHNHEIWRLKEKLNQ